MDDMEEKQKKKVAAILQAFYATKNVKVDNMPCQIEEGLFLGSFGAAFNKDALKSLNVTHILTVARSLKPAYPSDFVYKKISVADSPETDLAQHFDKCFYFIDEAKKIGGSVLVHCFAGRSRSVAIVVAYLMKKHRMSLSQALEHVKNKRPHALPNAGFLLQLRNFETSLEEGMAPKKLDTTQPTTSDASKSIASDVKNKFAEMIGGMPIAILSKKKRKVTSTTKGKKKKRKVTSTTKGKTASTSKDFVIDLAQLDDLSKDASDADLYSNADDQSVVKETVDDEEVTVNSRGANSGASESVKKSVDNKWNPNFKVPVYNTSTINNYNTAVSMAASCILPVDLMGIITRSAEQNSNMLCQSSTEQNFSMLCQSLLQSTASAVVMRETMMENEKKAKEYDALTTKYQETCQELETTNKYFKDLSDEKEASLNKAREVIETKTEEINKLKSSLEEQKNMVKTKDDEITILKANFDPTAEEKVEEFKDNINSKFVLVPKAQWEALRVGEEEEIEEVGEKENNAQNGVEEAAKDGNEVPVISPPPLE